MPKHNMPEIFRLLDHEGPVPYGFGPFVKIPNYVMDGLPLYRRMEECCRAR